MRGAFTILFGRLSASAVLLLLFVFLIPASGKEGESCSCCSSTLEEEGDAVGSEGGKGRGLIGAFRRVLSFLSPSTDSLPHIPESFTYDSRMLHNSEDEFVDGDSERSGSCLSVNVDPPSRPRSFSAPEGSSPTSNPPSKVRSASFIPSPVSRCYSLVMSTEQNHSVEGIEDEDFHGQFKDIRKILDYSYHKNYNKSRQGEPAACFPRC